MPEILINVREKLPQITGYVKTIVADNSDYKIHFIFDDLWEDGPKTVYFVRSNGYAFAPVQTVGDEVSVPVQSDVGAISKLYVGVQQGDVKTSRACEIKLLPAITDNIDDHAVQPEPDMWQDHEKRLKKLEEHGGGTGTVTSVAGVEPDETGNVPLTAGDIGAASADEFKQLSEAIADMNPGGMSATSANLLITILRSGTYTTDQSDNIDALEAALGGEVVEPDEPDEPIEPEEPVVTLVGITAAYTGGDVVVGTALTELTGISVLATYSDGSTATVTDYTLAGEITEGENTVTVTYEGLTTTFTVTGYVEASYPFTPGEAYAITWTDGYAIDNTTGADTESSGMSVSDYLPCEGASAFEVGTGLYLNYGLFYYDKDKNYLGKYGNINHPNNGYAIVMSFPATYVRARKRTSTTSGDTVTPVVYTVLTDSTPWEAGVTYNGDMVLGSLNSKTGAENSDTSWYRSGFVLCYGAKTLSLHPADTELRATVCWYDSEKNFISGATANGHATDAVPENAYYVRFASAVYKPFFTLA